MAEAPPKRSECGVYDCGSSPSDATIVCKTSWRSCLVKLRKELGNWRRFARLLPQQRQVPSGGEDRTHLCATAVQVSCRSLALRVGFGGSDDDLYLVRLVEVRVVYLLALVEEGDVLCSQPQPWVDASHGFLRPGSKKKKPNCSAQERPLPHRSKGRALLVLASMRGVTGLRFVIGPLLRRIPSRARRSRGSGLSGSGKPNCRWTLRIAPNLAWAVAAAGLAPQTSTPGSRGRALPHWDRNDPRCEELIRPFYG